MGWAGPLKAHSHLYGQPIIGKIIWTFCNLILIKWWLMIYVLYSLYSYLTNCLYQFVFGTHQNTQKNSWHYKGTFNHRKNITKNIKVTTVFIQIYNSLCPLSSADRAVYPSRFSPILNRNTRKSIRDIVGKTLSADVTRDFVFNPDRSVSSTEKPAFIFFNKSIIES